VYCAGFYRERFYNNDNGMNLLPAIHITFFYIKLRRIELLRPLVHFITLCVTVRQWALQAGKDLEVTVMNVINS
jgi:hypothetical protein